MFLDKQAAKMFFGYVRVSTEEQNLRMQQQALSEAGCEEILTDKGVRGNAVVKPQLARLLDRTRKGDTIVVWRLDRLSRSLQDLIALIEDLHQRGLHLHSIKEQVDTSSPGGMLYFHMVGAFAQFERDVIRERTRSGLESARLAGVKLGRPQKLTDEQWQALRPHITPHPDNNGKWQGIAKAATLAGVSRSSIYHRLKLEAQDAQQAIEIKS